MGFKIGSTEVIDASGNIAPNGDISLGDNEKVIFNNTLQIYSDGGTSRIDEVGSGNLAFKASNFYLKSNNTNEDYLNAIENGAVTVYHDGSEKLATTSTGIDVTGNATFGDNGKAIFGAGSDLQIYHDGSNSYIKDAATGELYIQGDESIRFTNSAGTETLARFISQNRVDLYYDNAIKFATTSTGVTITGDATATNFNTTSDATLKTNVETLTGSLDAINAMRGVSFDWVEGGGSEVGFIAQEVEQVLPEVVSTNDEGIKSVKYGNIVAVLVEALKEQQVQIDQLKEKLGE